MIAVGPAAAGAAGWATAGLCAGAAWEAGAPWEQQNMESANTTANNIAVWRIGRPQCRKIGVRSKRSFEFYDKPLAPDVADWDHHRQGLKPSGVVRPDRHV